MRLRWHDVIASGLCLWLCACADRAKPTPAVERPASEAVDAARGPELLGVLAAFADYAARTIDDAATRIEAGAEDRAQRKAALMWKVRISTELSRLARQATPAAALVDTWSLCVQVRAALEDGAASALFGPRQPLALDAARTLEQRIATIAAEYVPSAEFDRVAASVASYTRSHPLDASFGLEKPERLSASTGGNQIMDMLMTPLAPLRTFRSINEGVDSIREFRPVAERFTDVIEDWPARTRWELQLLLLNLEEAEAVRSALQSAATFSESAARLACAAEELPGQLRVEITQLLDDAEARQGALQATIVEARATIDAAREGLAQAETVAATIERAVQAAADTARAWEATASAVEQVVRAFDEAKAQRDAGDGTSANPGTASGAAGESAAGGAAGKPFDIAEYTAAADRLTATAAEVRGLVGDLRELLESGLLGGNLAAVDAQTQRAMEQAAGAARALTDHVAWRLAQLVLLIFALVVVYRFIVSRFRPTRETAARGTRAAS